MTSDAERDRPARSCSYNSCGPIKEKNKVMKCHSQPFLNPSFDLYEMSERLMKKACKILNSKRVDPTGPEPVDFTLDESKLILREIAQELDRIMQTIDLSLSTKVSEDGSRLEVRHSAFLLQLSQDLPPQAHAPEMLLRSAVLSLCSNGLGENRREACNPKPEEDIRLKKVIGDLSTWIWTLRIMGDADTQHVPDSVWELVEWRMARKTASRKAMKRR